jgi:hypothetical protein
MAKKIRLLDIEVARWIYRAEPRRRNSIPQHWSAEETSRIVWRDPEIGQRERLGSKSHATGSIVERF